MRSTLSISAAAAIVLLASSGCRVMHHEETTGQYVDDTTLKTRAKAALIRDSDVHSSDFTIDIYQGNVTLTGVARNMQEAKRAEEDVRKVDGVKSVRNELRVAKADSSSSQQ